MLKRLSAVAVSLVAATACGGPEAAGLSPLDDGPQTTEQAVRVLPYGQGDLVFLEIAASSAAAQVQMGQLAVARAQSPMVHDYAQYMVNYATSVMQRATTLANTKGQSVSTELGVRDTYHLLRLQHYYGADFDDKYLSYQFAGLDRGTEAAEDGYADSIDADVKQLATTLSHDLPQIAQLVEYVDLHRGSQSDVPGALDSVLNGSNGGGKDPSQGPAQTGQGQQSPTPAQEPAKLPPLEPQIPGKVPSPSSQQQGRQGPPEVPSTGTQQSPSK